MVWVPPTASDGMMISGGRFVARLEVAGQPAVGDVADPGRAELHPVHRVEVAALVGGHAAGRDDRELAVLEEARAAAPRPGGCRSSLPPRVPSGSAAPGPEIGTRRLRPRAARSTGGRSRRRRSERSGSGRPGRRAGRARPGSRRCTAGTARPFGEGEGVEARSGEAGDGGRAADQEAAAGGLEHCRISLPWPVQRQRNSGDMNISADRVRSRSWV